MPDSTDAWTLWTLATVFIVLGVLLPFINQAFDSDYSNNDASGVFGFIQDATSQTDVIGVSLSVFTMFFWTFGNVPPMIDLVLLLPFRLMFYFLLIQALPSGFLKFLPFGVIR